jgi:hypothetical protein
MDAQFIALVREAVREGVASFTWVLLAVGAIGAGVGAFVGSYLKKRGEQRAIREEFDEVLRQVRAQAKATEDIKAEIARELAVFSNALKRRSDFEQHVLLERYKLISEFAYRLSRIMTDLNRAWSGQTVPGLFNGNEVVPLTAVYEELAVKAFQLSSKFHRFFLEQADIALRVAQATTATARLPLQEQYGKNLVLLNEMVNADFGTDEVSWD